jgi:uncharacterized membrane protein YphA (DoxX/SURF4 family)
MPVPARYHESVSELLQVSGIHFSLETHTLKLSVKEAKTPRRYVLRRLLTNFPDGGPGFGLLLLRAAIGVIAISEGVFTLALNSYAAAAVTGGGLALLIGCALMIGLFTPIVSSLVALGAVCLSFSTTLAVPAIEPLYGKPLAFLVAVVAMAVALLGPGALSIDARLFGRREIFIPPMPRPSDPSFLHAR